MFSLHPGPLDLYEPIIGCIYCHESFETNVELQRHGSEEKHHPYACICAHTFNRVDALYRHINCKNRVPAHVCDPCAVSRGRRTTFSRRDHLIQHLRSIHHRLGEPETEHESEYDQGLAEPGQWGPGPRATAAGLPLQETSGPTTEFHGLGTQFLHVQPQGGRPSSAADELLQCQQPYFGPVGSMSVPQYVFQPYGYDFTQLSFDLGFFSPQAQAQAQAGPAGPPTEDPTETPATNTGYYVDLLASDDSAAEYYG
ncbi:hypothetical protein GGS20DRAFT_310574 [Poronia punctata]|nr:hypothetical protein GGS20DRAFT_310574 [Poronia punctata]